MLRNNHVYAFIMNDHFMLKGPILRESMLEPRSFQNSTTFLTNTKI